MLGLPLPAWLKLPTGVAEVSAELEGALEAELL